MKKLSVLLFVALILCSCSTEKLEFNNLEDPSAPFAQGIYLFEPTIENVIKHSTHITTLNLIKDEPYDENRRLYSFGVESLLAGQLNGDTITVLGYTSFYEYDETYLLFLNLVSFPEYPLDLYIPYNLFTFRVDNGEYIDCLQQVEDPETGKVRTFAEPFRNREHNSLTYLRKHIAKHSESIRKSVLASEHADLDFLLSQSDIIIEITPINLKHANPFLNHVEFEVVSNFKGEFSEKELTLPNTLEINKKYLVFFAATDDGGFYLMSRDSIFPYGSNEYQEFMSVWYSDSPQDE